MGRDSSLGITDSVYVKSDKNDAVSHYAQHKVVGYCAADSFENVHNSILGKCRLICKFCLDMFGNSRSRRSSYSKRPRSRNLSRRHRRNSRRSRSRRRSKSRSKNTMVSNRKSKSRTRIDLPDGGEKSEKMKAHNDMHSNVKNDNGSVSEHLGSENSGGMAASPSNGGVKESFSGGAGGFQVANSFTFDGKEYENRTFNNSNFTNSTSSGAFGQQNGFYGTQGNYHNESYGSGFSQNGYSVAQDALYLIVLKNCFLGEKLVSYVWCVVCF